MHDESVTYSYDEKQANQEVVCILCEGTHGNNTNCQRND
jgi:hypothetical protein